MKSVTEVWKPVVGHEGKFEVSNEGRVKSLPHSVRHWCGRDIPQPERFVKQSPHSGGYRVVTLRDGKKHFIHRIVMAAFAGDANGRDVNHIDGDKTNNRLENLEYCDRLHNVRHAIATGLQDNGGEGNGMSRYTASAITTAHKMVCSGSTHSEAARATGVKESTIQAVMTGQRWRCLGLTTGNNPAGVAA
jgi:hypothetical protein